MASRGMRKRQGFLEQYRLDERYLVKPDGKAGKPGILTGYAIDDGAQVLVKTWPKLARNNDIILREIWHNEVRQLHRLGGYPGAADTIANLRQAGVDATGFHLVFDTGQRRPLADLLDHCPPTHWLKQPKLLASRARMWMNLARLASGLDTLHAQGLLHRNLDSWAVLTGGGDEPDFQLTGFEWSIRLVAAAGKPSGAVNRIVAATASFLQDWYAFGVLVADLMGIDQAKLRNVLVQPSDVSDNISVAEIRLIRGLIQTERLERLDGEVVSARINSILQELNAEIANRDTKLHMVVRLGTSSFLSEAIRSASEKELEITEIQEQLEFVRNDLSGTPLVIAVKAKDSDGIRLLLRGVKLTYTLNPYTPLGARTSPSWEMAYCDRVENTAPAPSNLAGELALSASGLEVSWTQGASDRFGRLRGKLTSWQTVIDKFQALAAPLTAERKLRKALALTQLVDALYAAADAYPISVIQNRGELIDDAFVIAIRLREAPDRQLLSDALLLKPMQQRFAGALNDERRGEDWVLTDARPVGGREVSDTIWRLASIDRNGPTTYYFSGSEPMPSLQDPVFVPGDFVGRDIQFRRRLKALAALDDHIELTRMLADPRRRVLDSHETFVEGAEFKDLDTSKQSAFRAIIGTLPMFLVQGPPGVGKTRLVRDLVKDRFKDDKTSRILLTAQSNAAIEHVMDELGEAFGEADDALVVRCRSRDDKQDVGPYEVEGLAQNFLKRLSKSKLAEEAPKPLRDALLELVRNRDATDHRGALLSARSGGIPKYAKQAMEGLVVRAANVVYATTNSFELERLIEERSQFDWAIVEEAAKATGGELLSPMLLSHRRLLIGDQLQLPPFNSEQVKRLLSNSDSVRKALKLGAEFIGRALRDGAAEDILDELDERESDGFPALCAQASECLTLFESMIDAEYALQRKKPNARKIAYPLNTQHRMHPAIARVVSKAFYTGALETHVDAEARFSTEPSPILSTDPSRLPDLPIVVINMPYVQAEMGETRSEAEPRWHNPAEIAVVEQIVRHLKVGPGAKKPPRLAILSPYWEQVRRLKRSIDEANPDAFPNLSAFSQPIQEKKGKSYCGTVDSFQGNEAEVVIVSLVRNNHHAGPRSALGFLSDSRRMNVLFSRAKWRFILVGSIKFLRSVTEATPTSESSPDLGFLTNILDTLEVEAKAMNAEIIPEAKFMAGGGK